MDDICEEDLKRIREWPHDDLRGMLVFVKERWWQPGWGWTEEACGRLELSTGGWSGNEELIEALQGNFIFWAMCWESSRRGGHFTFDLNPLDQLVREGA